MTARKTLYLANPYGFSAQQKAGPLRELATALASVGAEVWEPFERNNQIDFSAPGWAWKVGQADTRDVREADGLFAVVNGCPPDEGVMVELGMAIAWGKAVFLFRDDFRRCTDSERYPLNLMLFAGLPAEGWESCWFGSIGEISDPGKALVPWLEGGKDAPEDRAVPGPFYAGLGDMIYRNDPRRALALATPGVDRAELRELATLLNKGMRYDSMLEALWMFHQACQNESLQGMTDAYDMTDAILATEKNRGDDDDCGAAEGSDDLRGVQ